MKNTIITLITMLLIANNIFPQHIDITGFLGVKLGQPAFIALRTIRQSYPQAEWNYPQIHISKVFLGGIEFKDVWLDFENDKLTTGRFIQQENEDFDTTPFSQEIVVANQEQAAITHANYLTQKYGSCFNNLVALFVSKYGNPSTISNANAIWYDNNTNSITINYEIQCLRKAYPYCGYHSGATLKLIYRVGNDSNNY